MGEKEGVVGIVARERGVGLPRRSAASNQLQSRFKSLTHCTRWAFQFRFKSDSPPLTPHSRAISSFRKSNSRPTASGISSIVLRTFDWMGRRGRHTDLQRDDQTGFIRAVYGLQSIPLPCGSSIPIVQLCTSRVLDPGTGCSLASKV